MAMSVFWVPISKTNSWRLCSKYVLVQPLRLLYKVGDLGIFVCTRAVVSCVGILFS